MSADRREQRRRRWMVAVLAVAVLLIGATSYAYWRFVCCYGIVKREPKKVTDLPPYGDELRRQELNPPEPTGAMPAYSGPGYYRRWASDQSHAAVTTDAAGYYRTVNAWDNGKQQLIPVISIKDADPGSGRAYRYTWSQDSKALLIYGSGNLPWGEDGSEVPVASLCFVYLAHENELYWIDPCHGTKW